MNDSFVEDRFAGKTIIVTGAGSGVGRASVVRLLKEGARVVAADIVPERLEALEREQLNAKLSTLAGDVTEGRTVRNVMELADGRVDSLVNAAGIMDGFLPSAEIDDATWDRVMNVNVKAVMQFTRAVIPLMMDAGSGSIVNVSSEAGLRGSAAGTAYTTSKHAVNGFTKSTAFFYAPHGIRCNAVAPGGVATDIETSLRSEFAGQRLRRYVQAKLLPPVATPEQVAAAVTWLLSADAANVSGVVMASDGGWAAI